MAKLRRKLFANHRRTAYYKYHFDNFVEAVPYLAPESPSETFVFLQRIKMKSSSMWIHLFLLVLVLLLLWRIPESTEFPHRFLLAEHIKLACDCELEEGHDHEGEMRMFSAPLPFVVNLYAREGAEKIPIDNQGAWGSCTAHAMRYAWCLWKTMENPSAALVLPSRTFWYAESRLRLGDRGPKLKDLGSTNASTVWVLANRGSIPETLYPYNKVNIAAVPTASVRQTASSNTSSVPTSYKFFSSSEANVNAFRTALANGQSIIFGILVYSSFMSRSALTSGRIPMPILSGRWRDKLLGGHAICISGYNDHTRLFSFRNSWGSGYGQNGTFFLPYDYAGNINLCGDAWLF